MYLVKIDMLLKTVHQHLRELRNLGTKELKDKSEKKIAFISSNQYKNISYYVPSHYFNFYWTYRIFTCTKSMVFIPLTSKWLPELIGLKLFCNILIKIFYILFIMCSYFHKKRSCCVAYYDYRVKIQKNSTLCGTFVSNLKIFPIKLQVLL